MQSAQTEGCVSAQTWRERIGRLVRVELVDGTALQGTLYTIDPGSQDIALLVEVSSTAHCFCSEADFFRRTDCSVD
jgi:hypothetical protein